jgi:cytochrome P450
LKIFGETIKATGGHSFEFAMTALSGYGPDKVLLYFELHLNANGSIDLWPIQTPLIVIWGIYFSYHFLIVDETADEQLLSIDNIPKSKEAYESLNSVIGKTSLVSISGDHWKKLRKMFNPAFAPSHLETMIPAIIEESQVFVEKLAEVADTGKIIKMNQFTTVLLPSSDLIVVFDD